MNKSALDGYRVLDFGQYIAGPAAAALLGDQGAEVIRIDPPGGPRWASPAMDILNRRKKSLVLDLKTEAGRGAARRLAATSDVVIENFRPAFMRRLGLDGETLREDNPGLVYLSLPGFSSDDGDRRHLRAWEAVIAAESGQFTDMGLNRILMGINPSFSPLVLASAYAALFGATAVGAALMSRLETGIGDAIEVPLASALMEGLVYNSMYVEDYPERYKSPREIEIERRKASGEKRDMKFADLQTFLDPFYRSYFCADDRPFYVVSASQVTHVHKTLDALGLLQEAQAAGAPELDDWYLPRSEWPEGIDCALGLYPLSRKWAEWFSSRMIDRFRTRTSFEWEEIFRKAGVPAVAHRTTREWLASTHAMQSGLVQERKDPERGAVRQAGPVVWLQGDADHAAAAGQPPRPDGDRMALLDELESAPRAASAPKTLSKTGWLDGVKILDMTNVIAGPTIASTLARFGADIIKLDPVKPTFDPWNTVIFGLQAGRGKRSILLDIKSAAGRPAYHRLIEWADIITINALDRQLEPLGLTRAQLDAINPKVVLCQFDAFGGPRRGPLSDHPGYDDLAQAMTGIMERFGGGLETPEEHAHLGTIDVLGGIGGAFASMVGLIKQRRHGVADTARTSLAAAGQLIQLPFMFDFDGRRPFDEPRGRETQGYNALYRLYEAADGHLFLAATDDDLEALSKETGVGDLGGLPEDTRVERLSAAFVTRPVAEWRDRLADANIGVGRVASLVDLRLGNLHDAKSTRGSSYHFDRFCDHPSGREIHLFAPCAIRPQDAPILDPAPTEKYGASTDRVLSDMGYSQGEIEDLVATRTAARSWSKDYLPE